MRNRIMSLRLALVTGAFMASAWVEASEWIPDRLELGAGFGLGMPHVALGDRIREELLPLPEKSAVPVFVQPQAHLEVSWPNGVVVGLAPFIQRVEMATEAGQVSFENNPFPHTLQAKTELTFNVWPLYLGYHQSYGLFRLEASAGLYRAYADRVKVRWQVDDQAYDRVPMPEIATATEGWMLSAGLARALGPGMLRLGFDFLRDSESRADAEAGDFIVTSAMTRLTYAWVFGAK